MNVTYLDSTRAGEVVAADLLEHHERVLEPVVVGRFSALTLNRGVTWWYTNTLEAMQGEGNNTLQRVSWRASLPVFLQLFTAARPLPPHL
jgi:hypothetical protein